MLIDGSLENEQISANAILERYRLPTTIIFIIWCYESHIIHVWTASKQALHAIVYLTQLYSLQKFTSNTIKYYMTIQAPPTIQHLLLLLGPHQNKYSPAAVNRYYHKREGGGGGVRLPECNN